MVTQSVAATALRSCARPAHGMGDHELAGLLARGSSANPRLPDAHFQACVSGILGSAHRLQLRGQPRLRHVERCCDARCRPVFPFQPQARRCVYGNRLAFREPGADAVVKLSGAVCAFRVTLGVWKGVWEHRPIRQWWRWRRPVNRACAGASQLRRPRRWSSSRSSPSRLDRLRWWSSSW